MEMNDERGKKPEAEAQKSPGKGEQAWRRRGVIKLRVQREKTAAANQREGQAEKEEDALKVALAALAENHNHPEERQKGASS